MHKWQALAVPLLVSAWCAGLPRVSLWASLDLLAFFGAPSNLGGSRRVVPAGLLLPLPTTPNIHTGGVLFVVCFILSKDLSSAYGDAVRLSSASSMTTRYSHRELPHSHCSRKRFAYFFLEQLRSVACGLYLFQSLALRASFVKNLLSFIPPSPVRRVPRRTQRPPAHHPPQKKTIKSLFFALNSF